MLQRDEKLEQDLLCKVKQGYLIKRSRILKEWKSRWMILTPTHLYSFEDNKLLKKPTECIPLKDITTIKSYYKSQYDRPFIFRVESNDANFYLSPENQQIKWAWMTAIQRMAAQASSPIGEAFDSQAAVRTSIKMSTVGRMSFGLNIAKIKKQPENQVNVVRKIQNKLENHVYSIQILPTVADDAKSEFIEPLEIEKNPIQASKSEPNINPNSFGSIEQKQFVEKKESRQIIYIDRIVQKIVEVPTNNIVYIDRQQIVYTQQQQKQPRQIKKLTEVQIGSIQNLVDFFGGLINEKLSVSYLSYRGPNLSQISQFSWVYAIYLDTNKRLQPFVCLQNAIVFILNYYCIGQMSVQTFDSEIQQILLNDYTRFIQLLYEADAEYFYSADAKILIDIVLRNLQYSHSDLNQFLNLRLLYSLVRKNWWKAMQYRAKDLKMIAKEISNLRSIDSCQIAQLILQVIQK